MSTKFITSGTLPVDSGANLTIGLGAANGVYYAVDRNAASGSASFLADNFSSWTSLPTGWSISNSTLTIASTATNAWAPATGTNYVAINRNIIIAGGGVFCKNGTSGTNFNVNIYLINCSILITGTPAAFTTQTIGCYPTANSLTDRSGSYAPNAGNGSLNLYGCDVYVQTAGTGGNGIGFAPTDIVGTDILIAAGSSSNTAAGTIPSLVRGGRIVGSRYMDSRTNTTAAVSSGQFQMYGIPAALSNSTFDAVYFGNAGQQAGSFLLNPTFTYSSQVAYWGLNVTTGDNVIQVFNSNIPANTAVGYFGSLYDGTGLIQWGGGSANFARAADGIANYQTIRPSYYSDIAQTVPVKNVRFRVYQNIVPSTTGTSAITIFPSTVPVSNSYQLICSYLSNASGLIISESYSINGGTSFSVGAINMLAGGTSGGSTTASALQNSSSGLSLWNTNNNSQSTPSNTHLALAQIVRMTALSTGVCNNYQLQYQSRSFTHDFDSTLNSVNYGTLTVPTRLSQLSGSQISSQNLYLKSRDVTAMNAVSNGIIDSTFAAVFVASATNVDENDVYDALRYEWYRFTASVNLPTITASGAVDFGSQNIIINSGATSTNIATRGYDFNGTAWTFRCPYLKTVSTNLVNGGIKTTGTVTLTSQATSSGTYSLISATTIALSSTNVYQNLTASTSITGFATTGTVATGVNLSIGSSAISMTGDLTFTNCTLSGTLTLTPGATGRRIILNNCAISSLTLVNATVSSTIVIVYQGTTTPFSTTPTGFLVNNLFNMLIPGTAGLTLSALRSASLFLNALTSAADITSSATVSSSGINLTYTTDPLNSFKVAIFVDGFYPFRVTKAAGSTLDPIILGGAAIPSTSLDFTRRASFISQDNTFISGCSITITKTATLGNLTINTPNAVYAKNDGPTSSMVIRAIMENPNVSSALHFEIASGTSFNASATGYETKSINAAQAIDFTSTGLLLGSYLGSPTPTSGWSIIIKKSSSSNNIVLLNLWNSGLEGSFQRITTSDVTTNVLFEGFSPGAIANLTGAQLVEIGGVAKTALLPSLNTLSDRINQASIIVPSSTTPLT